MRVAPPTSRERRIARVQRTRPQPARVDERTPASSPGSVRPIQAFTFELRELRRDAETRAPAPREGARARAGALAIRGHRPRAATDDLGKRGMTAAAAATTGRSFEAGCPCAYRWKFSKQRSSSLCTASTSWRAASSSATPRKRTVTPKQLVALAACSPHLLVGGKHAACCRCPCRLSPGCSASPT